VKGLTSHINDCNEVTNDDSIAEVFITTELVGMDTSMFMDNSMFPKVG